MHHTLVTLIFPQNIREQKEGNSEKNTREERRQKVTLVRYGFWTGRQQSTIDGTLLFVEQKQFANFLGNLLLDKDHRTTSIQRDRQKFQRKEALQ